MSQLYENIYDQDTVDQYIFQKKRRLLANTVVIAACVIVIVLIIMLSMDNTKHKIFSILGGLSILAVNLIYYSTIDDHLRDKLNKKSKKLSEEMKKISDKYEAIQSVKISKI